MTEDFPSLDKGAEEIPNFITELIIIAGTAKPITRKMRFYHTSIRKDSN